MTPAISVAGLTRTYRGQLAVDHATFDLEPRSITGLLGRNGAGKTTLMRILAGHEFASAGTVHVLGASPVENEKVLRQMIFVREDQTYPDFKVRHALQAASSFYPNWRERPGHRRRGVHRRPVGLQHPADRLAGVGGRGRDPGRDLPGPGRAAVYRLGLTVVQLIERGTGGWFGVVYRHRGLAGLLAVAAVALLAGGFGTVRRLAV